MRRGAPLALALALAALLAGCTAPASAGESTVDAPVATLKAKESGQKAVAIFAGGCFWGVEGVFSHVKGVSSAVSGYHGGTAKSARYDVVSSGMTDHAEAVRVVYDPSEVRYDQLLRIFFSVVTDPTTLNRQGPDRGTQYRSALIPTSAEQNKVARAYLAQLGKAGLWKQPIVTKIERAQAFYPAEKYHQDFMDANPRHPYIRAWDAPKVAALKAQFPTLYRAAFQRN